MLTGRSILCPVDLSEQSRQALLWASAIARYRGGELTVLSVVEPLLAEAAGIRLGVDLAREEVEPALREFVEATLPEGVRQESRVRVEVTVGDPAEAILQTGRGLKTRLIVMGTHGLGGLRKLLLGSTTEQVLRRTEWPVLAVPAGAVSAPAVQHPGVQLKRILLATDFRESAMTATQWAADLATDVAVPLVLAHVVEPVLLSPLWEPLAAEFEDERVSSGQRMLAKLSASFRDAHTECVVSVGHPADAIASLAVVHGAGLVVMGLANAEDSESRKPGSIAYRVLRIAHVAVVVVPHDAPATPDQPSSRARLSIAHDVGDVADEGAGHRG
jgi:nucleotide-binding universal stress UspA family protein